MRVVVIGLLAGGLAACSPASAPAGSAACAAATVGVGPAKARPGETVLVAGQGFLASCNDTGQSGGSGESRGGARDVPVLLEQDQRMWELGRASAAGSDHTLRLEVTIPRDARPGEARLRVGAARTVRLLIAQRGAAAGLSVDFDVAAVPGQARTFTFTLRLRLRDNNSAGLGYRLDYGDNNSESLQRALVSCPSQRPSPAPPEPKELDVTYTHTYSAAKTYEALVEAVSTRRCSDEDLDERGTERRRVDAQS